MGYRENVKRERMARGLSQGRLGDLAGVALNTIGQLERGDVSPTMDTLEALAKAMGLTVPDLVGESTAPAHSELCVPVPLVEETVAAKKSGKGSRKSVEEPVFRVPGHMAGNTRAAAKVASDTMYPTLWPGDIVLLDTKVSKPQSGAILLVEMEGQRSFRRMRRVKRQLMFAADNPQHLPLLVEPGEDYAIIGMALALLQRDLTSLRFR
jgi:transcriptional regulator with XRE-family HTH domain